MAREPDPSETEANTAVAPKVHASKRVVKNVREASQDIDCEGKMVCDS